MLVRFIVFAIKLEPISSNSSSVMPHLGFVKYLYIKWLRNTLSPLYLFRTIHYYAELGQRSVFPTCEVPQHFVGQVTVLKYFSHYMEENLMDVSKPFLTYIFNNLYLLLLHFFLCSQLHEALEIVLSKLMHV